jgi:outer membrane protein assembly factor BamA
MFRILAPVTVVLALLLVSNPACLSQTGNQSSGEREVLIDSFVISGTRAVDSAELAEITNSMSGSAFNDDSDELEERIRDQFQNHGYFKVEVKHLDIKVIDPLASPKPVRLEADISEGPLCRLSGIEFTGNHAIHAQELRAKFPIKTGNVFKKSEIGGGLESMQKLYGSQGFLDSMFTPNTQIDSASTVKLDIEVQEGPQYRMGKLEIAGPAEVAEKLQARWEIAPGTVFDAGYVRTFLDANSSLLPADFTEANSVKLLKDCSDATVAVHLHLTADSQHDALDRAKTVNCDDSAGKKKNSD